jgi:hypothetical protein
VLAESETRKREGAATEMFGLLSVLQPLTTSDETTTSFFRFWNQHFSFVVHISSVGWLIH